MRYLTIAAMVFVLMSGCAWHSPGSPPERNAWTRKAGLSRLIGGHATSSSACERMECTTAGIDSHRFHEAGLGGTEKGVRGFDLSHFFG